MAPQATTKFAIPTVYVTALEPIAAARGLSVGDYITGLLISQAVGAVVEQGESASTPTSAPTRAAKGPGRPVVVPEDIPTTAERDASESGFVGVTRDGRWWKARIGRAAVGGKFSTPEAAALARHFAQLGFRIGRAAFFGAQGLPVDLALSTALKAGFAPLSSDIVMQEEAKLAETIGAPPPPAAVLDVPAVEQPAAPQRGSSDAIRDYRQAMWTVPPTAPPKK